MLINDLKPKTKSLAISAVTLRNDSAAVTARKVNRFNRLIPDSQIDIEGYDILRRDRNRKRV